MDSGMELQKDDITLPGGLGSAIIDGKVYDVVEKTREDHGAWQFASTKLTMRPVQPNEQKTEDAEYDIVKPKPITLDEVCEAVKQIPLPNDIVYMCGVEYWAAMFGAIDDKSAVITEDAEFEIVKPKELTDGNGSTIDG
jgi:hypothetical protein